LSVRWSDRARGAEAAARTKAPVRFALVGRRDTARGAVDLSDTAEINTGEP
jgi:hypothetical protein